MMVLVKRILSVLVLAASLAVLSGCSPISSGTITDRVHKEAYWETYLDCAKSPCKVKQRHHSEVHRFDLKSGDETGWVHVDEEAYD